MNPRNEAGGLALEIYRRTLERIRGDRLVEAMVSLRGDRLTVDDLELDLPSFDRILVFGAGKASVSMARGLENVLGNRIDGGLIVTKHGYSEPLRKIEVMEAGHPVPDAASLEAGQTMLERADQTTEKDLVLFVLSGGASALLEAPRDGVSLEDLQDVNRELLASGATIMTMNAIRARLSRIKAGGLAQAFGKATVVCLAMSDVLGNRLNVIGSGPFVPPSDDLDIPQVLRSFGFDEKFPPSVLSLLAQPYANSHRFVEHRIVGDARMMGEIAVEVSKELGLKTTGPWTFDGDGRDLVRGYVRKGMFPTQAGNCLIATGETTIAIQGDGLGGRAQDMAVVAAKKIAGNPNIAVLIAGSDGTDGPTDAAGAFVDGETLARAAVKGFDYEKTLADNDSYHFHEAAGSLIKTGPTGSNLNDIMIVVNA